MKNFISYLVVIACLIIVTSCATEGDPILNEIKGWSVEKLYFEANNALQNKSYSRAIKLYSALESTYPYGKYAQQGLLELSYAYYENDNAALALATIDQFIITYPSNQNIDYALYLKGYINYNSDDNFYTKFIQQDSSELDPQGLKEAYTAFSSLINNFPHSKYVPDAILKLNAIVDSLAKAELLKATYYMDIKAYIAAINRANNIITSYNHSNYLEEALAIEILAYKKLQQNDLSLQMQEILKLNYPNSKYINHIWKSHENRWYAFFDKIFLRCIT